MSAPCFQLMAVCTPQGPSLPRKGEMGSLLKRPVCNGRMMLTNTESARLFSQKATRIVVEMEVSNVADCTSELTKSFQTVQGST